MTNIKASNKPTDAVKQTVAEFDSHKAIVQFVADSLMRVSKSGDEITNRQASSIMADGLNKLLESARGIKAYTLADLEELLTSKLLGKVKLTLESVTVTTATGLTDNGKLKSTSHTRQMVSTLQIDKCVIAFAFAGDKLLMVSNSYKGVQQAGKPAEIVAAGLSAGNAKLTAQRLEVSQAKAKANESDQRLTDKQRNGAASRVRVLDAALSAVAMGRAAKIGDALEGRKALPGK